MNKNTNATQSESKKERPIYVIGRPSLDNLTKEELNVFYHTLLDCIVDFYKNNKDI